MTSIWRKLRYFFSPFGPVLWMDDRIKEVERAIEVMRVMKAFRMGYQEAETVLKTLSESER